MLEGFPKVAWSWKCPWLSLRKMALGAVSLPTAAPLSGWPTPPLSPPSPESQAVNVVATTAPTIQTRNACADLRKGLETPAWSPGSLVLKRSPIDPIPHLGKNTMPTGHAPCPPTC